MNKQREVIYGLRNKVLDGARHAATRSSRVARGGGGRPGRARHRRRPQTHRRRVEPDAAWPTTSRFLLHAPVPSAELEGDRARRPRGAVRRTRPTQALDAQDASAEFGAPFMREVERHVFLFTIDEQWRDHLYELDHLKGGIGLRAYGQKDPLLEYKKEAFTLFERAGRARSREESVQRLFRVAARGRAAAEVSPQPRRAAADGGRSTPRSPGASAARRRRRRRGRRGAAPAAPAGGARGGAPAPRRAPVGAAGRAQRPVPVRQRQEVQEVPPADRRGPA